MRDCSFSPQSVLAALWYFVGTPIGGGAFAHLILMTASANIFYNRGAIVLAIYLLDMKAPAYKCKIMPSNRNFDLDHDAGNALDTKITEPRVQTRLCLAEKQGFEPWLRFTRTTPLAGEPLRPLGYFSVPN